jgi:hypothetical protein
MSYIFFQVENIKVSQSDPTWVINIKKSIASSLQLNSDAVRGNFPMYEKVLYHDEKEANALVNIYENTIFGELCHEYSMHKKEELFQDYRI